MVQRRLAGGYRVVSNIGALRRADHSAIEANLSFFISVRTVTSRTYMAMPHGLGERTVLYTRSDTVIPTVAFISFNTK